MKFDQTVSIGKKVISFRFFTLEEYITLLEAQAKNDHQLFKKSVQKLLTECTNGRDLSKIESELLLIVLIIKSRYQNAPKLYQDCVCGEVLSTDINHNLIQITPSGVNERDLGYDFGKFKVKLKEPKLFDDDDIISMVVKSIDLIYAKGETISVDELSDAEMTDLLNAITRTDIEKISNLLLDPELVYAVPVKCTKCGEHTVMTIQGFNEFFKILG